MSNGTASFEYDGKPFLAKTQSDIIDAYKMEELQDSMYGSAEKRNVALLNMENIIINLKLNDFDNVEDRKKHVRDNILPDKAKSLEFMAYLNLRNWKTIFAKVAELQIMLKDVPEGIVINKLKLEEINELFEAYYKAVAPFCHEKISKRK